ncbi:hypothetical protein S1OALGB6SA_555 [Olavius algarvensis spirochete endosymbiont]|uniref:TraR/DksA family transcriptional regulator n=1 Tax=Olavius algarvensis spirochete endosymbiont TaxID=260710 RepID=UPI000F0EECC3|nr:TraR/DksA family transcriptional regulator [Olavius algarvensis spirochete endosymbiont]VDA99487.1 hypothetical protein S1OALGB6SA_555 [Olavius algarvensis spirochete endosymbiont]
MNEKFKTEMQRKLTELKEEVLNTLINENKDFRAAVEDMGVKDLADVASNDIDARILEVIGTKDTVRLKRIEAALGRLENGRFGICVSCGKRITDERLSAIPYAVMCINCQTNSEHRRMH